MKVLRLIVVTGSMVALFSCGNKPDAEPEKASTPPANSGRTFADWCREKASLSPEAKQTVEVLLKKAETTKCEAANQKLSSLTKLDLDRNQISDIKPLQDLTNLTSLYLSENQISDLKPLESLTKLFELSLGGNPIASSTCPLKPESICNWEPQTR